MIDTAKLRALLAAATPGPWREGTVDKHHVFVPHPDGMGLERVVLRMNEHFPYSADAALIAAAVNALPALLDELEALRAERDAWRNATHSPTPADLSASVAQHAIDYAEMQAAWRTATGCDTPEEAGKLTWFSNHHAECRDCRCDHVPREPGCTCCIEVGDDECPIHDEPEDDHGIHDELGD